MSTVAWASKTSLCVCPMISWEDILSATFEASQNKHLNIFNYLLKRHKSYAYTCVAISSVHWACMYVRHPLMIYIMYSSCHDKLSIELHICRMHFWFILLKTQSMSQSVPLQLVSSLVVWRQELRECCSLCVQLAGWRRSSISEFINNNLYITIIIVTYK